MLSVFVASLHLTRDATPSRCDPELWRASLHPTAPHCGGAGPGVGWRRSMRVVSARVCSAPALLLASRVFEVARSQRVKEGSSRVDNLRATDGPGQNHRNGEPMTSVYRFMRWHRSHSRVKNDRAKKGLSEQTGIRY